MSKEWLIGFTEAEGSFYLTKKGPNRIIHCFEITQKKDEIVLIAISLILEIKVLKKIKKEILRKYPSRIWPRNIQRLAPHHLKQGRFQSLT